MGFFMWYDPYHSPVEWARARLTDISGLRLLYYKCPTNKDCLKIFAKRALGADFETNRIFIDSIQFAFSKDPKWCFCLLEAYCDVLATLERDILTCFNTKKNTGSVDLMHTNDADDNQVDIRMYDAPAEIIRMISIIMGNDPSTTAFSRMNELTRTPLINEYTVAMMIMFNYYNPNYSVTEDSFEWCKQKVINALKLRTYGKPCNTDNTSIALFEDFSERCVARKQNTPFFPFESPEATVNIFIKDLLNSESIVKVCKTFASIARVSEADVTNIYATMESFKDEFETTENMDDCVRSLFNGMIPRHNRVDMCTAINLIGAHMGYEKETISKICESVSSLPIELIALESLNSNLYDDLSYLEYLHELDMRPNSETVAMEARSKAPIEEDDFDVNDLDDDKPVKPSRKKMTKDSVDDDDDIPVHGKERIIDPKGKGAKVSNFIKEKSTKVYSGYRKYKAQEQKIDSQVSKITANLAKSLIGIDSNTNRRRVMGDEKFSVAGVLKRVMATYAIFSYNKIAALLLVITRFALRNKATDIERSKILDELKNEIDMVEEKIQDARASDKPEDRQAKYRLMRTKQNLENAYNRILYSKKHRMTIGAVKDASNAIKSSREE